MESIIERQRKAHEEVDRIEQIISEAFMHPPKRHREKVAQEQFLYQLMQRASTQCQLLIDFYKDREGLRVHEIQQLQTNIEMAEFYTRLRSIKELHRSVLSEPTIPIEHELELIKTKCSVEELEKVFSGEESFGKYLDLNLCHEKYVNLKHIEPVDYVFYLENISSFSSIPQSTKNDAYLNYLNELVKYLEGFFKRSRPLFDLSSLQSVMKEKFDKNWEKGMIPGWPLEEGSDEESDATHHLYCVACQKQFAKQTVFDAHLHGKKHIKATAAYSSLHSNGHVSVAELKQKRKIEYDKKRKPLAWKEVLISCYFDHLSSVLEATRANVERKRSRTIEEREKELEEEEFEEKAMEENDLKEVEEERLYNPLKLPLGWDGKPIPYWLYKLHGLGVQYNCEICGNYVYMGRKAFDSHFQEWRHSHGMKCLGIPNTRHFQEITAIKDAFALWDKLKTQAKTDTFKAETMEEFEDLEGNVFNRKTFEDLHRQGLL